MDHEELQDLLADDFAQPQEQRMENEDEEQLQQPNEDMDEENDNNNNNDDNNNAPSQVSEEDSEANEDDDEESRDLSHDENTQVEQDPSNEEQNPDNDEVRTRSGRVSRPNPRYNMAQTGHLFTQAHETIEYDQETAKVYAKVMCHYENKSTNTEEGKCLLRDTAYREPYESLETRREKELWKKSNKFMTEKCFDQSMCPN